VIVSDVFDVGAGEPDTHILKDVGVTLSSQGIGMCPRSCSTNYIPIRGTGAWRDAIPIDYGNSPERRLGQRARHQGRSRDKE
jgi:hypothetical protein